MTAEEFLLEVVSALESSSTPYMVTGSFASSMLGMPRTTRDLNVVVELDPQGLDAFLGRFDSGTWYLDPQTAQECVLRRSMFNAIHVDSGWKVDFVVRKDHPWSREEFARRQPLEFDGRSVFFVRAEDSILSKPVWAKERGSDRQIEDAGQVVDLQRPILDLEYLRQWSSSLGVSGLLDRILRKT
jgi:hypothetical protein